VEFSDLTFELNLFISQYQFESLPLLSGEGWGEVKVMIFSNIFSFVCFVVNALKVFLSEYSVNSVVKALAIHSSRFPVHVLRLSILDSRFSYTIG
jgi:hypothetical protein